MLEKWNFQHMGPLKKNKNPACCSCIPSSPARPSWDSHGRGNHQCRQSCGTTALWLWPKWYLSARKTEELPSQFKVLVHQLRQSVPVFVLQSHPEKRTSAFSLSSFSAICFGDSFWVFIAQVTTQIFYPIGERNHSEKLGRCAFFSC